MVVMDRLTKRMVLIPTKKSITGEGAARLFAERIFREHGMPRVIISDRDPRFTGTFWRKLHELLQTKLMMSTANHPQTDGQSERALRSATAMLRHYVDEQGQDWDEQLWAVEFAYNDAVHASTGFSPFQLDLGRDPATPVTLLARLAERTATAGRGLGAAVRKDLARAEDFAESMRDRLREARGALLRAQRAAELDEAEMQPGMVFAPGDYVFLRSDALGGESEKGKFGPKWYPEPLKVSERVGLNSYRLVVPKAWGMHPVRNVSELKSAGEHRPSEGAREGVAAGARVLRFIEHSEPDGERRLRVRLSQSGRTGSSPLLAHTAIARAGFAAVAEHARTASVALPNYLGRLVTKKFGDADFDGLVVGFDPADPAFQFEIEYADGDLEWIPASSLQPILQAALGLAADLALLAAMAEEGQRWLEVTERSG